MDGGQPDGGSDVGGGDAGIDAGTTSDASIDPDAGAALDASGIMDAAISVDAAVPDATAVMDAGPPMAPVGAAVDVTGTLCALDAAGNFWCWGRWTAVEAVRILGSGFVRAAGSCAQRPDDAVWCADFAAMEMVALEVDAATPVIGGAIRQPLVLDEIAEYSDVDVGCGRIRPGDPRSMWGNSVCWTSRPGGWKYTDGYGSPLLAGSGGEALVAVSATEPRERSQLCCEPTYDAYDVNPPATCRADATGATCTRDTGGSFSVPRPAGDHFVLGFGIACAHDGGATTCSPGGFPVLSDDGAFHDQAVAWPIGMWSVVSGVPRYYEARGICISGNTLRCYDERGVLEYTVDW